MANFQLNRVEQGAAITSIRDSSSFCYGALTIELLVFIIRI